MASRASYRDRALVIRTYDFGEADRIVVLLTRCHGLVRAVAKGVRKTRSRFGSRIQPFVDLDVQLYPGRNLATITAADTVGYFASRIIEDFERYAAGCAVLETAERLAYAEQGSALFDATSAALADLQRADSHPTLVLDAFILRATEQAGWGVSLFDCANCQAPGPHRAFNAALGGAVCSACRPLGSADVDPETLHVMWLLQHGHPAETEAVAEVHRLTTAHLQWHLEAALKSLRIMEQA
ncbi:DNA repair protein RecO [Corynebacterium liangguodongii]|uniref:DNA repair protein RecO n=1 Tax=Corynebacterium liangguodongii TaxID=2079535 RepID=A0A2S0WFL4_9CORY|nr:DNA repair protein RecO [Corynebacterium liangguodongii]AWB84462.1 DNA repair protein RecO [Corynebacterium liangguodongii]PWB99950.1 DNA repair protein RecO [Corynebacterium liangguodongii]